MNIHVKLWFFTVMELSKVAEVLEDQLELKEFVRDYEDTWEWCESMGNDNGLYIDISRKHNWKTGVYDYPVGVHVTKNNIDLSDDELNYLAIKISDVLDTIVYKGSVEYISGDEFVFHEHRRFCAKS